MRPRSLALSSLTTLALGLFAACGSSDEPNESDSAAEGFPVTIERCGREVTVHERPERVASLNQGSTEILLSLGVADRMVGASGWTDSILESLADENKKVDRLADQAPSYEALLATEPDLVTASFHNSLSEGGVTTPENLASLDIPAYLSAVECEKADFASDGGDGSRDEPLKMDAVYTEIRDLAALTGEQRAGEDLVEQLTARMAEAEKSRPAGVSVLYWFANAESPYVAGCCGGPGVATQSLGLENVFQDQTGEWPQISWEAIAAKDPDVLVIGDLTRKSQTAETAQAKIAFLESNPVTKQMKAVKNRRYIAVAGAELNPSIRTVDLVEKVAAGIDELDLPTS